MPIDPADLVGRAESPASLVRFEDATDANTPRLNYSVPLPGAFSGKFYIETDFHNQDIPWTSAARIDQRKSTVINDFVAQLARGNQPSLPVLSDMATLAAIDPRIASAPPPRLARRADTLAAASIDDGGGRAPPAGPVGPGASVLVAAVPSSMSSVMQSLTDIELQVGNKSVSFSEIARHAAEFRAPVVKRSFGGTLDLDFVAEAPSPDEANPRFMIIEHYRLSSFFGDYGAGRTVGVFSLMPGEETNLYVRNWRRSKTTIKEASSIFDSFTIEAANEFETDIQAETTNTESQSQASKWHSAYSGSGEINIGLAKTSHSGQLVRDKESASARETVSKNTAKVATKHSSKASAKRETEVTQELEASVEEETERITERKIRNTNMSRTLNVVTRELNQEFTTYLSLVDVTLAFVNDLGVMDVYQLHDLDRMLDRYITVPVSGGLVAPGSPFGAQSARSFVRQRLINQVNEIYDFRGTRHDLLEEVVVDGDNETVFSPGTAPANSLRYLRMRRSRSPERINPFYEPGDVPVEGVVLDVRTHTVRTPAVVIDSLLGHGVALDNYALGLQQEALREKQLNNRKVELALDLIAQGDAAALAEYRQLFGSVDEALLREVALGSSS